MGLCETGRSGITPTTIRRQGAIYVAQHNGKAQLINSATNKVTARVRLSTYTARVTVIPRTGIAYVTNQGIDTVSMLRPCRDRAAAQTRFREQTRISSSPSLVG
jgi:DNA-binding beta-propeller fold protein YncE